MCTTVFKLYLLPVLWSREAGPIFLTFYLIVVHICHSMFITIYILRHLINFWYSHNEIPVSGYDKMDITKLAVNNVCTILITLNLINVKILSQPTVQIIITGKEPQWFSNIVHWTFSLRRKFCYRIMSMLRRICFVIVNLCDNSLWHWSLLFEDNSTWYTTIM